MSEPFDDFWVTGDSCTLEQLIEVYNDFEGQLERLPKSFKVNETNQLKLYKEILQQQKAGVLFRKRADANNALINYWLSRIKDIAKLYPVLNEVNKFSGITKQQLVSISKLSANIENLNKLESELSKLGVILVIEPSFDGIKMDGSVFITESGYAVIAMTLRYNRLDNFWFTLMHELSHLCLHSENLLTPIIEDLDEAPTTLIEKQADRLALDSFIPRHIWRTNPLKYDQSTEVLCKFAEEIGVHPAIVAGRYRKETNRWDIFSKIVNSVDVRSIFL